MEAVLENLRNLLINSLPTFFIVLLLHLYLKSVFFGPVGKVLKERYNATAGARKQARESLDKAHAKAAEFETTLRSARVEVANEQEEARKKWRVEQTTQIDGARVKVQSAVAIAKDAIAGETATARASLLDGTEALADQIANAVLRKTA